ncbi:MAG: Rpn family recombination-promoting nuclease/putative transposase [Gammaproteobacteria bacterium]|nr:Rpn family recombination-promoting nuclease/putative transposase [Gammaproteobacteria bacterium]
MSRINIPHDIFSKQCLGDLTVAVDFLKAHLPESIKQRCDFTTLRGEPTSYIEEATPAYDGCFIFTCHR